MPRLRRSDCSAPGLGRRRCGRGFVYLDQQDRRVGDPVVLERIRELAIPPAWRDVWICADARGHLQATGFDDAGRKQYLYHDDWRRHRDRAKFATMLEFAVRLPRLRRRARRDLASDDELDRTRVLAAAVRLLDIGCFRIGSDDYARANGSSHGLTTVRREHVSRRGAEIVFDYPAKSGQRFQVAVADPGARAVLDGLLRRRRPADEQLLAYRDGRLWRPLRAEDVNDYLKECLDGDFTAKDFRTWNATVLTAVGLGVAAPAARTPPARRRAVNAAVAAAAACLGNTPAVCRAAYVDPRLIDGFLSGWAVAVPGHGPTDLRLLAQPRRRARLEAGVLDLLGDRATDAVVRVG